ncbi:hypothetical protein E2C01_022273 [Portunus trituberculatus]|uniref:Uncharacterized protein n=1 Tax=Portunus trituberculatus TaxID=210409 RepID=A0A5B7E770_PORTR|nr:hypothetical protein [Portunus trituberculatus]
MKRYPSQPTTLSERGQFVVMWVRGKSARTIARETGVNIKEMTDFQSVESITRHLPCRHATLLLTDGRQDVEAVRAPQGVTFFQVEGDHLSGNATLETIVDEIRQLGAAWHCLVVVVVSDDPAFLAAFAHLSLRRHALRWSTRILVLTRLPLSHLGGLHGLLSNRNAMLLRVQGTTISRFSSAPTLTVAIEVLPYHRLSWVNDADAPGGRRLEFKGYVDNIVRHFAKALNFTPLYTLSPERTFGTRLSDGSWTGLIGMVVRQRGDCRPPVLNEGARTCGETMKRYPSQPTTLSERSMFVSMWIGGKSARTIARETGVSPSTVCRWINRWKQEGNVDNHKPLKIIYAV